MRAKTFAMAATLFCIAHMAQAAVTYIEAEAGLLNGTVVAAAVGGYLGTGYVDGFDNAGDSVQVTYHAPSAGMYDLRLRYNEPFGPKVNDLYINGVYAAGIDFPVSTSWVDTAPISVYLNAGDNTLRLQAGWGWVQLDRFAITPAGVSPLFVDPTLVTSNPSPEAQDLFCYLSSQYGHKIIGGQTGPADATWIQNQTGRAPALCGFDMMDYSPSRVAYGANSTDVERAIAWSQAGGIVQFQWHWNAPDGLYNGNGTEWWRGFYTPASNYDLAYALANTNSQQYADLIRDLDAIAVQLKRLRDAHVPVIWRPLHEAEGGWFWWGAKGAAACRQLYRLMFQRYTQVHGLNNLIWVWVSTASGNAAQWYPGNEVLDMVGADIYAPGNDYGPQTATFYNLVNQSGGKKMVALTENGPIPDPALMEQQSAWWSYFMTWNGFESNTGQNALAHVQQVFTDTRVLSRDELPQPIACPRLSTPTPSLTVTTTPTVSRTASMTATRTASATTSRTASATASSTATPSRSQTGSPTLTFSPSRTSSVTVTPSPSQTTTASASPTASPSPSLSVSSTLTASPSSTVSSSPSMSVTSTATLPLSPTSSTSVSATPTASASASATATASLTSTLSRTASPTPSRTATLSSTQTLSSTPTYTASPQNTSSASPTQTTSPTCSRTLTSSATPKPPSDPLGIERSLAAPNPFSGTLFKVRYLSQGSADEVELRVFAASSLALVAEIRSAGPKAAGWHEVVLPWVGKANGLYIYQLWLKRGGILSGASLGKCLYLR